MPQANQADSDPNQPNRDNHNGSNPGLWWILGAGAIFLLTLMFVSIFLPNQTERAKFFTENALSILVLVAIAIQVYINRRQWASMETSLKKTDDVIEQMKVEIDAVRDQAELMRQQLEVTDRPWLAFDAAFRAPLTFTDTHVNLFFRFSATSVGRSVAVNAIFNAEVLVPPLGENFDLISYIRTKQAEVSQNLPVGFIPSVVVFPNEQYLFNHGASLSRQEVERSRFGNTDLVFIYLVACVDYQIAGHPRNHQTRAVYEIERRIPEEHGRIDCVRVGEDVSIENLVLRKSFMFGDSAD